MTDIHVIIVSLTKTIILRFYKAFCSQWFLLQSQVDEVQSCLMKRDASLIAAISGAEVEVASI